MAVTIFLYEDSDDACYWYLVGYILKASQVVPTSEPMGIFISSLRPQLLLAMMIVMRTVRISFATL